MSLQSAGLTTFDLSHKDAKNKVSTETTSANGARGRARERQTLVGGRGMCSWCRPRPRRRNCQLLGDGGGPARAPTRSNSQSVM